MNKTFHIVHTESSCGWGGQEIRILTEAEGMQELGHKVTLIANHQSPIANEAKRLGIETIEHKLRKNNFIDALKLRSTYKKIAPDVINTHSSTDSWLSAIARIGAHWAIVRTRHISAPIPNNVFSKWLYLKGADRIATTGEKLRLSMIEQLKIAPSNILSVKTGIDIQRYSKGNALDRKQSRESLLIPEDSIILGIAATLRSWKGHDYLLQAFDKLSRSNPNLYLLIVGEGPMQPHIQKQVKFLSAHDRIFMPGQSNQVENLMAAMDIFVLPSYANEGVPQAIMQAMSMSLPVISTNIGAITEAVIDNETGLIVAIKDSGAIAKAVQKLIDDRPLLEKFSMNARLRAEKHFTTQEMLENMSTLFSSAIAERTCKFHHKK